MAAAWATYQERVFAWTLGLPSQFHCAGTEQPYAKVPSYWSWECLDWLLCWEANERFQPGFSLWPSAVGYFQKNPSHLILGQRRENKTKQKTKQNYQMFWLQWKKKKKKVSSVSGLGLWYQISSKKERKRLHEIQCIVLNWLNIVLNIQYWWEEWEWWNTYFLLIILNVFRHPRVTWFPSLSLLFPILFDFTTISLETAWNKMSANKGNKRKQLSACKQ